jgi:hypothetical protein
MIANASVTSAHKAGVVGSGAPEVGLARLADPADRSGGEPRVAPLGHRREDRSHGLGEHLMADAGRQTLQLVEATRPLGEGVEHDEVPFPADDHRGSDG